MPNGDAREQMAMAMRQTQEFMLQARQQAQQQLEMQRYQIASVAGPAAAAGVGFGGAASPQPGTPAGRLMETITGLIQRGAGMAGGAAMGVAGAGLAQVGGFGNIAGQALAAPIEMANRTGLDAGRSMTFWQSAATAMRIGFAAQRFDMTATQAQVMAREGLESRLRSGAWRGVMGAANAATLGLADYLVRSSGAEVGFGAGREAMTAGLQQQLRYTTREELERAGLGGFAGPFATGISREGARALQDRMRGMMGAFQAETGLTGREMATVQAQAAGTMGRRALISDLAAGGGGLGRQMQSVREIRQVLNMNEQEAAEFFNTIGQMHGTADRIAGLARRAQGMAGRLGLNAREIMTPMLEFERMGIQMGMGAGRARGVAEQYVQNLYENYTRGGISAQQMMMYGGRTPEEAVRIQAQVRFQQNIGMWNEGRGLMGVGVLAQDPSQWGRFMTGTQNFVQTMGAVGGAMARDPFAMLKGRFDPRSYEVMGGMADRAAFNVVYGMRNMLLGNEEARRTQMYAIYSNVTGMKGLEARSRMDQMFAEADNARAMAEKAGYGKRSDDLRSLYSSIVGQGFGDTAMAATGKSSVWEATQSLFETMTAKGTKPLDTSKGIEEILAGRISASADPKALERLKLGLQGMGPLTAREGVTAFSSELIAYRNDISDSVTLNKDTLRQALKGVEGYASDVLTKFSNEGLAPPTAEALTNAVLGGVRRHSFADLRGRPGTPTFMRLGKTGKLEFVEGGKTFSMDEALAPGGPLAGMDQSRLETLFGSTFSGGLNLNITELMKGAAPADLTAFESSIMRRKGSIVEALMPTFKGGRLLDVARGVAEMGKGSFEKWGISGLEGFASIFRATKEGGLALETDDLRAVREALGPRAGERLVAAGVSGFAAKDIDRILSGRGTEADERTLRSAISTTDIAKSLFRDSLSKAEMSKPPVGRGNTPGDPIYVEVVNKEAEKKTGVYESISGIF